MKKLFQVSIVVITSLLVLSTLVIIEQIKKPSFKYLRSVSVYVKVDNKATMDRWVGSGVIVKVTNDYTYILTNKHVAPIEQDKNVYILNGDDWKQAEVLKNSVDKNLDMSLIRIVGTLEGKRAVKGIVEGKIQDKIFAVGNHGAKLAVYREGVISTCIDESCFAQMAVMGGDSGSGLFNKNGKLVGLVYALELDFAYLLVGELQIPMVLTPNHTLGIALNYKEIKKFLKDEI